TVAPAELTRRLSEDPELMIVDVRTPGEFDTTHIRGSYNVPLDLLTEHTADLAERMHDHVVLVCQSVARASAARSGGHVGGFHPGEVLEGGIAAEREAGGTVVGRGSRWAMDRQVRMPAGALVLLGTLAGQLIHPRLGLFAGAIGAGLTYSALSDSCAMASVLSRMPWNRVTSDPSLAALFEKAPTQTA